MCKAHAWLLFCLCLGIPSLPVWLQANHFTHLCVVWGAYHPPDLLFPPPRLEERQLLMPWGLPGLAQTPTQWNSLCVICTAPSPSTRHCTAQQWTRGSRRQHQQATLNMFRKNKIKQQSSLEQERLSKRVLPGSVSSCFLLLAQGQATRPNRQPLQPQEKELSGSGNQIHLFSCCNKNTG